MPLAINIQSEDSVYWLKVCHCGQKYYHVLVVWGSSGFGLPLLVAGVLALQQFVNMPNEPEYQHIINRVNIIKNIDWKPRPTVRVSFLLLSRDDGNKDIEESQD